jgi:hypothetical protein
MNQSPLGVATFQYAPCREIVQFFDVFDNVISKAIELALETADSGTAARVRQLSHGCPWSESVPPTTFSKLP